MRTYLDKRDCLMTPSGDDLFSPAVRGLFDKTPEIINRILCQVVGRLMEIKITYEEYLLLIMIVFCNPCEFDTEGLEFKKNFFEKN